MEKQVVVYINPERQFDGWRRVAPAMPLMVSLPDIQGPAERSALWEQPVQKGIRALQTDHPEDLIAWLIGKSIR
jgi:glycerophosphoryl diester phosphodiesterase